MTGRNPRRQQYAWICLQSQVKMKSSIDAFHLWKLTSPTPTGDFVMLLCCALATFWRAQMQTQSERWHKMCVTLCIPKCLFILFYSFLLSGPPSSAQLDSWSMRCCSRFNCMDDRYPYADHVLGSTAHSLSQLLSANFSQTLCCVKEW